MRRLAIAEDHKILRETLKGMLEHTQAYEVICEASNGLEAIKCIEHYEPEMLLLDLSMPIMGGMSVLKEVKERFPKTKILILTMHKSEEYVREGLELGADGYCLKDCGRDDFIAAIEKVLGGGVYFSPGIADKILAGYLGVKRTFRGRSSWDSLTRREKEVLKLVGEGHRNKEIANILSISLKTVEKHRSNIIRKLDIHSVASLTAYAFEKGLVTHGSRTI